MNALLCLFCSLYFIFMNMGIPYNFILWRLNKANLFDLCTGQLSKQRILSVSLLQTQTVCLSRTRITWKQNIKVLTICWQDICAIETNANINRHEFKKANTKLFYTCCSNHAGPVLIRRVSSFQRDQLLISIIHIFDSVRLIGPLPGTQLRSCAVIGCLAADPLRHQETDWSLVVA